MPRSTSFCTGLHETAKRCNVLIKHIPKATHREPIVVVCTICRRQFETHTYELRRCVDGILCTPCRRLKRDSKNYESVSKEQVACWKKHLKIEINAGTPIKSNSRVKVECKKCGCTTTRYLKSLVGSARMCTKCESTSKGSLTEHVARLKAEKPRIKYIGGYAGNHNHCTHMCKVCKTVFKSIPYSMFESLGKGCKKCATKDVQELRRVRCQEEYYEVLNEAGCTMLPAESYKTAKTKIKHKCTKCGYERHISPDFMKRLNKCTNCSPKNKVQEILLKGKVFLINGYEGMALKTLLRKYKVGDVATFLSGEVPIIKYRYKGKNRRYYPDLFVKSENGLVEVKSLATLGLKPFPLDKRSDSERFYENAEKAKAVVQSQYKFKLMVFNKDGTRMRVPSKWYNLTFSQMKREMGLLNSL